MLAVVDCNNFFVSCERVFRPHLENKPVAVLSNNDGCIVSRSQEVKKLGIPMGVPLFKVKDIIERYDVKVFSGNFPLYGDLSNRVMQAMLDTHPDIEVYSIDEAFINLDTSAVRDYKLFAEQLRAKIKLWTGIPVSVGVAPTKTLAKAANEYAKTHPNLNGVCVCENKQQADAVLNDLPVNEVWGVGYKYSYLLKSFGIFTALQLAQKPLPWVNQFMHVMGERTVLELRGIPCMQLHTDGLTKKHIVSSRSFGTMVNKLEDLAEAVAVFTARAAEKLRRQNSVAAFIGVSIATNRHRQDQPQYFNSYNVTLPFYSNDTSELIRHAEQALQAIYLQGFFYKRAAVYLGGIMPKNQIQYSFFHEERNDEQQQLLMKSMDKINMHWGQDTVYVASMFTKYKWKPLKSKLSQAFTTKWTDLPLVKTRRALSTIKT